MNKKISLYMTLELLKVRQNHINNVWIEPYSDLVFKIYLFKDKRFFIFYIQKNSVHEKWTCRGSKVYPFRHYEALDMMLEIKNLKDIDEKEVIFISKYSDIDILNLMERYSNTQKSDFLDTFFLEEEYKSKSKNLLDDIYNTKD